MRSQAIIASCWLVHLVTAGDSAPGIDVSTTLIHSGDVVTVTPVGISPHDKDAIVAYYSPGNLSNASAIASYDFYRSSAPGTAAFIFRPVNLRTGGITFAYVRNFTGNHIVSNASHVLASTRVYFHSTDEQLGIHLARTALPTQMRVTWTSNTRASTAPASVSYGVTPTRLDRTAAASSSTFTSEDLCHLRTRGTEAPANPFDDTARIGPVPWHDRGWIHTVRD